MNKKVERNSNIELLRIFAMIMIIMSHYSVHGGFSRDLMDFSFNKVLLHTGILGNLGVDIFFLISGYFLCKSNFNIKKIFKLLLQVISYTLIIYLVFCLLGIAPFLKRELLYNMLPVTFERYWFVTTYVILYLVSPYLNKIINNINQKEHGRLIMFGILILGGLYTLLSFIRYNGAIFNNTILISFLLYFIGAYIQKYGNTLSDKLFKIILILSALSLLIFTIVACKLNFGYVYILAFYHRNSIFIIGIAVSLLVVFSKLKFTSKIINIIASCTFGVYLLHDNDYIRSILWGDLLKNNLYQDSNYLIIHYIVSVILVFVICTIIEFIRKNTIQRLGDKLIDKYTNKIIDFISNMYDSLKIRIGKLFSKSN